MCYDDTARPPSPSETSGTPHAEELVLTAADGNRFAAYAAHPALPARAEIIIVPDAGGLRAFFKELAVRFAEAGVEAVAFDFYGRTAGLTARGDSFDWREHASLVQPETFFADLTAALACLRRNTVSARATFTIGFCMGGSFSFWSGTTDIGLTGAIGFYAHVGEGILEEATGRIKIPILGLFGEADQFIPASHVDAFDKELDAVGVEHEITVYPGAPHGFFELQQRDYAEASADAWKRVLSFIEAHLT